MCFEIPRQEANYSLILTTGYKAKQYSSHLVLCHGAQGPEVWPRDIDMMTGLTSAITAMSRKELKVISTLFLTYTRDLLINRNILG